MKVRGKRNLKLGSNVIQMLLPHRKPFLMVDTIESYERTPTPFLHASRSISSNEDVFTGHFPQLHLWPGVYTIEGLGQSSNLLMILLGLQKIFEEQGKDPEEALKALRNLELGFKLLPGVQLKKNENQFKQLKKENVPIAVSGSVDMKFLHPVFAGQRLDYLVTLTHELSKISRFDVEAQVSGKTVARGFMTGAFSYFLPAS